VYEPVIFAGANKRLETGTMREDAWWTSIPSWRVSGDAGTRADR
jgi:hypothetical protein